MNSCQVFHPRRLNLVELRSNPVDLRLNPVDLRLNPVELRSNLVKLRSYQQNYTGTCKNRRNIMTGQQDTTGTIPTSVNTFWRLTKWLEKEAEQVRVDLQYMFDNLVEHQVDKIRNKLTNRFVEIIQSHIQEVAQTYPGLELVGSIEFKDDIFLSLFKDKMVLFSRENLKTCLGDSQRMVELDQEYPGVLARIKEIDNAFRFYQKQNAFQVNRHRINIMTRIAPDGTVINPQFPQEQHTSPNQTDDRFHDDDNLPEDIYREFIDSLGMTEEFEKFRAERSQSGMTRIWNYQKDQTEPVPEC